MSASRNLDLPIPEPEEELGPLLTEVAQREEDAREDVGDDSHNDRGSYNPWEKRTLLSPSAGSTSKGRRDPDV